MTLYAPDLEAQRAWVAALRKAGEQVYDAEELKAKATALQEMAPLLLDQAQRQFKRMHQILASLKCTGYVCLLYTSPSPRDQRGSRMPSSA